MINVYWAPWHHPSVYPDRFISYKDDPTWLIEKFTKNVNKGNRLDNFYKCPAFVDQVKNTLVLYNTSDIDVSITRENNIKNNLGDNLKNHSVNLFNIKAPSELDAHTVSYSCNWIFFADKPVTITTTPTYMHDSGLSKYGYYVPGTFDISKWFRPLEFAFQLWPGVFDFKSNESDPLLYVKFNTEEKINLQKFYMTQEIYDISNSCISFKKFSKVKALNRLYELFKSSGQQQRLLSKIRENLI